MCCCFFFYLCHSSKQFLSTMRQRATSQALHFHGVRFLFFSTCWQRWQILRPCVKIYSNSSKTSNNISLSNMCVSLRLLHQSPADAFQFRFFAQLAPPPLPEMCSLKSRVSRFTHFSPFCFMTKTDEVIRINATPVASHLAFFYERVNIFNIFLYKV